MNALSLLEQVKVVPVVVIEDAETAVPLAEALLAAGIEAIEITLRTEAALSAIEQVAEAVPGIILGAGSVRSPELLRAASRAGAVFGVCPGFSDAILNAARQEQMYFVPGASTPSEMLYLQEKGYVLQKFFPAELSGGLPYLKAVAAPLPEVRFFPTGGINARLVREYLAFDSVVCVGGSWFISNADLASGNYQNIEASARQVLEAL